MIFTSPLWLLALIPWAGVALWLLAGRNPRVTVPFVQLWRDQDAPRRHAEFRLRRPPIALVCLMLSMLLALVGAAKPVVIRGIIPVHILIDHGVTMSGRTSSDRLWTAELAEVRAAVKSFETEGDEPASGLNTREMLVKRVEALKSGRDVVVISNQALGSIEDGPGVVRVPIGPRANVGLVRVAARENPRARASVMVRVRNESDLTRARVSVAAEAASPREREIELPARGGERDYFFDVDRLGDVISIELIVDDGVRADNYAWLVRAHSAPRIEMRASVSPEVARMAEVYARHRATSDQSAPVAVVDAAARLAPNDAGVIVASASESLDARSPALVRDHPITAHVRDWNSIARDALVAPAQAPGEGWTPIVRVGDRPLVAVREQPVRQVWIGFASTSFARSADFVIFWTDIFDWLGGNRGTEFVTGPVVQHDPNWRRDVQLSGEPVTADPAPGVYRDPNDELRAMSAIDLKFAQPSASNNWREKLASLVQHPRTGATTDVSRPLLIAALVLIAAGAMFWNRQRAAETPTIPSDRDRTVAANRLA